MGNRMGLHMALAIHPDAFVYFSSASHYSIKKSVTDHDGLAGRWDPLQTSRFADIPADELGRMDIDLHIIASQDFLRRRLGKIGVAIRYNDGSLITVLE
ncbi:MAG: hypothetical protein Q9182_005795 [Xanthomendoza sp. 2 TL-2023]